MSAHANRVKMTVTSVASSGTGDITLNAASTGFRSFATAYSNANATVDILITEGTAWEIARNCTYTHSGTTVSRGTLENSSTGSAVVFTADAVVSVIATAAFGNNAALNQVAASPTTAGVTGVVGTMHLLNISGLTGARDFVLPTVAATGDRIGVFCTTDAPTTAAYVLQIKSGAAGDLINGTDHSSTIWSSLFITGECLIFRCVDGSTVDWIVEYDGRIPQYASVGLSTDADGETSGTYAYPTALGGAWTNLGSRGVTVTTADGGIAVRRACLCSMSAQARAKDANTDANYYAVGVAKNGTLIKTRQDFASGAQTTGASIVDTAVSLVAADKLQLMFTSQPGSIGARGQTAVTFLIAAEVL